jgi:hypothetical protein
MNAEQIAFHRGLVAAVILQAVRDHQANLRQMPPDVAATLEPARWVYSDDRRPFGFVWCCALLDLAPGGLRGALNSPWTIWRTGRYPVVRAGSVR